MVVKLTDFGLATVYDSNDPLTERYGSLISVAPEILTESSYGPKKDCWALGIILYELLSGNIPFYHDI